MGYLRILRTSTKSLLTLSALSKSLQDCTFGVSQDSENTNPVLDNCRQFFAFLLNSLSPCLATIRASRGLAHHLKVPIE
jgi:hypothetical protein